MIERFVIAFVVTLVMILVMGGVLYLCKYKKAGVCKMNVEDLSYRMSDGKKPESEKRAKQGGDSVKKQQNNIFRS